MVATKRKKTLILAFVLTVLAMFLALLLTERFFSDLAPKDSSKTSLDLRDDSSSTPAMINPEGESSEASGHIIQSGQIKR